MGTKERIEKFIMFLNGYIQGDVILWNINPDAKVFYIIYKKDNFQARYMIPFTDLDKDWEEVARFFVELSGDNQDLFA